MDAQTSANGYVGVIWLSFARVTPPGSAVRQAWAVGGITFVAFMIGVPCAVYALWKGSTIRGAIGLLLCVAPWPLSVALLHAIADYLDLFLKP